MTPPTIPPPTVPTTGAGLKLRCWSPTIADGRAAMIESQLSITGGYVLAAEADAALASRDAALLAALKVERDRAKAVETLANAEIASRDAEIAGLTAELQDARGATMNVHHAYVRANNLIRVAVHAQLNGERVLGAAMGNLMDYINEIDRPCAALASGTGEGT